MSGTVVVVNPSSSKGHTGRHLPDLMARARSILGSVELRLTTYPGHATRLTADALDQGADCVIAVGGDGTNNEVVNGFILPDGRARSPQARFSFVPMGTGGDLRRTFAIDKDVDKAFARARNQGISTDVGWMRFVDHAGNTRQRAFINIASAGLSGVVDKMVNTTSKGLGPLSFAVGSLRGLLAFHPYPITVHVDGTLLHQGPASLCAAANGRFFGGGMQVAPRANPEDGLLDVVCLPPWDTGRFLLEARRLYAGNILGAHGVVHARGTRVTMDSPEEALIDMDGEQPGRLPATFTVLPGILKLCR